ncbi:MAG TPA: hypothetical protein PKN56_02305 [Leptospiraceae bacterium]|nr:hypothetical protein [Leptospiraceae bacterium]HNH07433.1 hypothetical protein [Leptospiraceae bacterium]HNI96759.1 hypothetical protein [Leptospiraceae bacterium]HNN02373.1 hypothetical protein [Leptospiraceae bacterium]HNO25754.1 hypothetical protein [Leptospiraceae bacterium]
MNENSAVQNSIEKFCDSYREALNAEAEKEKYRDFDPLWLGASHNSWDLIPEKIRTAMQYGEIDLFFGDRELKISLYPKKDFPGLSDVLRFFRFRAEIYYSGHYHYIFSKKYSTEQNLERLCGYWKPFLDSFSPAEIDGEICLDIADILQNSSLSWNCHWKFRDTVLDRYAGDQIDYNSFFVSHFFSKENSESFETFVRSMQKRGMNRSETWKLFSPSGERIFSLAAVLEFDEYFSRFILETGTEFLDFYIYGRR